MEVFNLNLKTMAKRKICAVTSNRSDYTRMRSVLDELKKRKDIDLKLVVSGSHILPDFGKTIDAIKKDGFKVDILARTIIEGEDLVAMSKSIGVGIQELSTIFDIIKPDIVLVVGDRFDALSVAIAASIMNIHVAHIQGGEVTGTIDESIRHAITKLAHIHFPATKKSRERIIKMGENPNYVFHVGCPSMDAFAATKLLPKSSLLEIEQIKNSKVSLDIHKPYCLLIQHPVTTEYSSAFSQMKITLEALYATGIQTIMVYPNVDAGSVDMMQALVDFERNHPDHDKVIIKKFKNIYFNDYIQLLAHASFIIGNSSSGIRESCFFGVPSINIGTRQSSRERGKNIIDVPHDKKKIKEAINKCIKIGKFSKENLYGNGNAGKEIARTLAVISLPSIQKMINY